MKKPTVNVIKPDIKNLSIYLRSTKKWGKSTLFRDMIMEKYGDPYKGLLVGCGNEIGYTMLDNLNSIQVETYNDLMDLKSYLIDKVWIERDEKGKVTSKTPIDHDIQIVAFDTGDELTLITDTETIRQSNLENPNKKVKSIKAAFGGYTAGEKYSANNLIKPFMNDLKKAGFGVWMICHTKFKTIKEKGGLEEDGYMQLTSNLSADYESAFGDIFDVVLTGVIDRDFEEKKVGDKVHKYATDTVRKLYFRETPLIDAGGRFADGAVPEYMVFESGKNNAAEFIKIVEEGMEKSKTSSKSVATSTSTTKKTKTTKPAPDPVEEEPAPVEEDIVSDSLPDEFVEDEVDLDADILEEESDYPENLLEEVMKMYKACEDKALKKEVGSVVRTYGKFVDLPKSELEQLYSKLNG